MSYDYFVIMMVSTYKQYMHIKKVSLAQLGFLDVVKEPNEWFPSCQY